MNPAIKFVNLTFAEKRLTFRAMFWVLLYRVGLWFLPFRWARNWVRDDAPQPFLTVPGKNGSGVNEIVNAVKLCSRYVPHATCLTQALAARRLLLGVGQYAVLKIGVAKSGGNFEAHAWLEIDGRIIIGKQRLHSRYAILAASHSVLV